VRAGAAVERCVATPVMKQNAALGRLIACHGTRPTRQAFPALYKSQR
jgi:hypothetical protein